MKYSCGSYTCPFTDEPNCTLDILSRNSITCIMNELRNFESKGYIVKKRDRY
jgi:hypothetical protein